MWWCSKRTIAVLFSLMLFAAAPATRAAVSVALVPSVPAVAPGTDFEVAIRVTQTGSAFNAYQAIVRFDPAALTFLPTSPLSLQEGVYMTSACGTTFHWFTSGTTEVGMVHSLMCAGQSLTGPGDLYRIRFRATGPAQTTAITFTMVDFANAGNPVTPVNALGTSVVITQPSDVSGPPGARIALRVAPNPFNPSTTIEVDSEIAGPQQLAVFTSTGRLVRVLQDAVFEPGSRRVVWDGRGRDRTRLASGVYVVQLRTRERTHSARVILLK